MRRILLFLMGLWWSGACLADQRATYHQLQGSGVMIVEAAANGDSRFQPPGQSWYLLLVHNESYVVYPLPAGPLVVRIADLETLMRERGLVVRLPPGFLRQGLLVPRGRATYGGHSGDAIYLRTPYGMSQRPAIVISHEPALAPLGHLLARQSDFSIATLRLAGAEVPPNALVVRDLLHSGTALLLAGYALERVDTVSIDPARFALPAAPASLDALRNGSAMPH